MALIEGQADFTHFAGQSHANAERASLSVGLALTPIQQRLHLLVIFGYPAFLV